jgi:hypothetical protein
MRAKIGVVIAGVALGIFVVGRAENRTARFAFAESSAWAQESDDQTDDAVSQGDDTSQADTASPDDADATKPAPVSAGGIYSGTVMDNNMGAGKISAAISQIHAKISGTWQDTFVPPAFINGTIKANGKLNWRMRFGLKGNCGYLFTGVFKNGNEISGSYKVNGCGKKVVADHGTLDMTKQ